VADGIDIPAKVSAVHKARRKVALRSSSGRGGAPCNQEMRRIVWRNLIMRVPGILMPPSCHNPNYALASLQDQGSLEIS
jgi:hypothetical protein